MKSNTDILKEYPEVVATLKQAGFISSIIDIMNKAREDEIDQLLDKLEPLINNLENIVQSSDELLNKISDGTTEIISGDNK